MTAPQGPSAFALPLPDDELVVLELPVPSGGVMPALTAAEAEVLALVVAGWSNAEIARSRGTSARTVANQVAGLLARFGVGSRHALAARLVGEPG